MVSEEMFLWGYDQTPDGIHALDIDQCKILLHTSSALDISNERQDFGCDQIDKLPANTCIFIFPTT